MVVKEVMVGWMDGGAIGNMVVIVVMVLRCSMWTRSGDGGSVGSGETTVCEVVMELIVGVVTVVTLWHMIVKANEVV